LTPLGFLLNRDQHRNKPFLCTQTNAGKGRVQWGAGTSHVLKAHRVLFLWSLFFCTTGGECGRPESSLDELSFVSGGIAGLSLSATDSKALDGDDVIYGAGVGAGLGEDGDPEAGTHSAGPTPRPGDRNARIVRRRKDSAASATLLGTDSVRPCRVTSSGWREKRWALT
jgi:hypothetical protein